MFERFTDRARTVVIQARATAAGRGDQIRPVYLPHALASAEGKAARALAGLGVDAGTIGRQMDRVAPRGRPLEGEADSADAEALASIGIDLDEIKRRIEDSFGPGALERVPLTPRGPLNWTGRLPLAEGSKLTLALALREARALHHTYIGTEHLLLGLLRVAERQPHADFAAGIDRGPLQGIPLGIKDILATSDAPTTANSLILAPQWGEQGDGPIVARLRAAGAVFMGKLTTMEFAIGMPDAEKPFPVPRNPWNTDHWPGGSSSGTGAGVAAQQSNARPAMIYCRAEQD